MKWIRYVCLFSVMILLVGCSGGEKTEVKIGEVTRSIFYAPLYVAIEEGFFKDEGLDVK